jgi:hypothetical protein
MITTARRKRNGKENKWEEKGFLHENSMGEVGVKVYSG